MVVHKVGDVLEPGLDTPWALLHVCNNLGVWGGGVSGAIGRKYPAVEKAYGDIIVYRLGDVLKIQVGGGNWVANMIAQNGTMWAQNLHPLRYTALMQCLENVCITCEALETRPIMPRIGAGLAGGHWPAIERIIDETLGHMEPIVFTLPQEVEKWENA